MEIVDAQVRKDILNMRGSLVISASAGSGKTTIMIKKILEMMPYITDHRIIAAITFTVKATEEIKRKFIESGENKNIVVMTNDSFIEFEIIRPFIKDAFKEGYRNDFLISYDNSSKFNSFEEGMKFLESNNKLGLYRNVRNFKFELAKKILENSQAAREYFKYKYIMLFLDEYQDSDLDMHNLFMYIKNELNIDLFIVGDGKQAIYLWRGAQRNIFNTLEHEEGITMFELVTNFRSHPEIVNYANLMHNVSQFNSTYDEKVENVIHCRTLDHIQSINALCDLEVIDRKKSIAIISNFNKDAKEITDRLNEIGFNFIFIPRTPLDDGSENSHILKGMASYILDINYSIYDLAEVLRIEQKRSVLNTIEKILNPISEMIPINADDSIENVFDVFYEAIKDFENFLGLNISLEESKLLLETLNNKYFYSAFVKTEDLHKVMTVFGSKGLEFDQVISFSSYYNFLDEGKKNNHYVCVTRAKEKFIMFEGLYNEYSDKVNSHAKDKGIVNSNYLYKIIDHT